MKARELYTVIGTFPLQSSSPDTAAKISDSCEEGTIDRLKVNSRYKVQITRKINTKGKVCPEGKHH